MNLTLYPNNQVTLELDPSVSMGTNEDFGIYAYQQAIIRTGKISPDTYVLAKAIADSITLDHFNKARKQ